MGTGVLCDGSPPGGWARCGVGTHAVNPVSPGLVFCPISGFGQTGPYKSRPAYDQIMQGISGLMSITGEPDGDPQKVGIAVADIGAGMWAAFAVMAAIHNRSHEGEGQGQYIDISMMDAQVAWLTYQSANFFATGEAPNRLGAAHPNLVPDQGLLFQDQKYLHLAIRAVRMWDQIL